MRTKAQRRHDVKAALARMQHDMLMHGAIAVV